MILSDITSDDIWARFERYSYHPRRKVVHCRFTTIFLRLTEGQQSLFTNLRELNIDTNFATDTSILLFLAIPLLISFPMDAEVVRLPPLRLEPSFIHHILRSGQKKLPNTTPLHQLLRSS
ncbi:hypothetical protein ARMGADRAFT_422769 [Armillaria gallica]|uniref:Uncharacterized protein n=1 Tax=Armillaria gallica TaxID=47427 RepID=A0A2H3EE86_ARMGA|nr:hypothetical protein ARMGADRAFT_422769 [Armillaria gallica]